MSAKRLGTGAALAVLGLATAGISSPAGAVLQLSADNNGTLFSCADNAACDTNPAVGILEIGSMTSGGLMMSGSLSTADLAGAVLNTASLQIVNLNHKAVTVTVSVGADNFVGPRDSYTFSGSDTFLNAKGATVTDTWWNDPGNAQPADSPTDRPGDLLGTGSYTVTQISDSAAFNTKSC
jgi:hypothetical protein